MTDNDDDIIRVIHNDTVVWDEAWENNKRITIQFDMVIDPENNEEEQITEFIERLSAKSLKQYMTVEDIERK